MRILVCGDLHLPYTRKGYLEFCQELYKIWDCKQVVLIGDVVDWHSISFHPKHPDGPGSTDEYVLTKEAVQRWYKAFPKAKVCIGNHDERVVRLANSVQIPEQLVKTYNEMWGTKGWDWKYHHIIDDIYFYHGTGQTGEYPACNAVKKLLMSVCIGHNHRAAGVKYYANPQKRIFAMDVGTGIDDAQMAFFYGRYMKQRSIVSAGVIIDGVPIIEPMPISKGERFHDSKFRS